MGTKWVLNQLKREFAESNSIYKVDELEAGIANLQDFNWNPQLLVLSEKVDATLPSKFMHDEDLENLDSLITKVMEQEPKHKLTQAQKLDRLREYMATTPSVSKEVVQYVLNFQAG